MKKDVEFGIKEQLITKEKIQKRLKELGEQITEDFKNENEPLIVVGLLRGSIVFMADLIREIRLPLEIDFIEASSYGEGTQTSREVKILKDLRSTISGKNVLVVEDIIESHFVQNNLVDEAFVKHVLIVADENSSVSYVERFESVGDKKNTANIVVEVIAKQGAKVQFAAVDTLGQSTDAYVNRRGYLEKDATINWALGIMNDGNVIADFDSELRGDGSHSQVNVIGISTGRQVQGIDTRVTNYAPHSVGHILQHGVILDKSTLTFNGIGHIIKGAKFADAQQESRVLMLSEGGRGDANPILLIDENEVTAGHAASVGQVDDEQLFYLTSRGISEAEAKRLVIRGFLGAVIRSIPSSSLQKELVDMIEQKLVASYD